MSAIIQPQVQPLQTHYRACHLCEAICGLKIVTQGEQIVSIKGDFDDPLSRGHICPKGVALKDLHTDSDRLHYPVRKVDGQWQPISWEDAYQLAAEKLAGIQERHGDNSVGVYAGNPNVHNYGHMTHGPYFTRLLHTRNRFSATSVDQLPQHLVSLWMYGHQHLLPVPDIDHTDLFMIIGGNPAVSNGSLMTVPNVRQRMKAIKRRGGRVIVIDPRRTETANLASEHLFIRPGSDAALLLALIHELFRTGSVDTAHLQAHGKGLAEVEQAVASFTPQWAADFTGIDSEAIRNLAGELSRANRAAVYGRLGISTHDFGTLCHWAVQMLNLLTGNLDAVGGTLLTHPAINPAGPGDRQKGHYGRWHSRVRQLPEFAGELPCSAMTEEIQTPGEGQIKALVTIAGNPVLSTPSGDQLESALDSLEFMVSIDPYINETTRHADLILPPASPLVHGNYDLAFLRFAVRNVTRFNQPVFEKPDDERYDWQIFQGLAEAYAAQRKLELKPQPEPEALIRHWLAHGPYHSEQSPLDLDTLLEHPHGVDLGPLRPSLTERLCTEDGQINCWPQAIAPELQRLASSMDTQPTSELLLIGRRDLRTNNSWMHNSYRLVKGKSRCVLLINPEDMAKYHLSDGELAHLTSRSGRVLVAVEASTDVMPGVVSLPHGWGHHREGSQLGVACEFAGVSINDVTDNQRLDPVSGNAVLSGLPVTLQAI